MNTVARLSFAFEAVAKYQPKIWSVVPVIDGTPLTELISVFEGDRRYEPVGGYGGLVPAFFDYGPLDRYLMGHFHPDSNWARMGGIYVLGCDCGEVGCWPLLCRVWQDDDVMIWEQFRQPHRPEPDYSQFGPFTFDREQYGSALQTLQAQYSSLAT